MKRLGPAFYLRKDSEGVKFYQQYRYGEDGKAAGIKCMVERTTCYGLTWKANTEEVTAKQGNEIFRELIAEGYTRVTEAVYNELQPWD